MRAAEPPDEYFPYDTLAPSLRRPVLCDHGLYGRAPSGESRFPPDLPALAVLAAPRFFHVELYDRTTLPADLWARESEDSLSGLFLREMRRRLDGADEGERDKLLLCARFGLAALEGGEDVRP